MFSPAAALAVWICASISLGAVWPEAVAQKARMAAAPASMGRNFIGIFSLVLDYCLTKTLYRKTRVRAMHMSCRALFTLWLISAFAIPATGEVGTNRPDPVPGAKAAIVEHIKIHGKDLEGNLEGDAVDRDALVILPPGYGADTARHYPV